ncbi:alkyl hydroperoxide reductase/ Thiol specific antioxidant/ Mal allergen [Arcobacter nitrofigilis DSM 7299]|uniref:Alkyl hydroperoxide reductase/ Thiol specific antioxidant/ Mal allergen n=1 Tax=Arcobacter nitrofigilis (strain ATCC 33309 / DSM 7299 / CCUG 15893 / LMG 7604 / NCTC 12251 / CI) TaxID=572480 RepID=D5V0P7_ARCNC|nr:redoxin domain-containing protein [Arcobacter nitrofigilis]ADG93859.1 alkyl hydroperoxide reductase/ Thiol specific antioxidant/ Mal allergen [Arcobacter nitrofigilis DSM 7299]
MKDKIKKYLKEGIIIVLMLIIAMNGISYYKSLDLNKDRLDINTFTLLDGKTYDIPKDKPVLIHFWAAWCPICKVEASNIEKISKEYEVITIAVQSGSKEEIQKYLKDNKLTFKVVNDEDGLYSQKFNIKGFPTTFIYNKDKKLRFSEVGYTSTIGLYIRMLLSK